ncbi:MAG: ferritin [Bacteroidetes bacterium]|nr:ferritin [Bacteroidota bacterium]
MISNKIEDIINIQIEKEGYSSNLYLAMASWAENQGFAGTAEWLHAQAEEERSHMLKFIAYVNDRGGKAIIPDFKKPPSDFVDISTCFKQVMEHERYITNSINEIVALCAQERDFTTQNWVQWFVNEQIQEEKSVQGILDKLRLLGPGNLYMFDRDVLAMRQAEAAPAKTA